jgi:UDP-glucose 6-dehydrogenase
VMLNIVIAGYGPVGKAMESALSRNPKITTYIDDPLLNYWVDSDLVVHGVIVAVATPADDDGDCNTDNVDAVFTKYGDKVRYLVKSTIDPVWLTDYAPTHCTFSPEFLRGSTSPDSVAEFINGKLAIYGSAAICDSRWWHDIFEPVLVNLERTHFVSLEQAAFSKYVLNTFLATKVAFFNEMYRIYTGLGFEDFGVMVRAIADDPRLGHSHTQVPGPDGKYGFGGHCFPKDISALQYLAQDHEISVPILSTVIKSNKKDRKN